MYKLVQDNKVIDVVKHPKFIRFLRSGIAITDKTSAQGIVGSDGQTLYGFAHVKGHDLPIVSIIEITNAEFESLNFALASGRAISADESILAKAKKSKIDSLSTICKNKITAGFDIELADGNTYNFKLTAEDQLNLIRIESLLTAGETAFVYHATNQPCRIFNKEDMLKVVGAFRKHVLYHTTYFNAAKQYINKLTDIEKVNLFSYGTNINSTVKDSILKQILINGGNLT